MGAEMFFCFTERKNISPFVNGGVAGDVIRNIKGEASILGWYRYLDSGALFPSISEKIMPAGGGSNGCNVAFDSSRVVPTGNEFSPRTASVRRWRRVA